MSFSVFSSFLHKLAFSMLQKSVEKFTIYFCFWLLSFSTEKNQLRSRNKHGLRLFGTGLTKQCYGPNPGQYTRWNLENILLKKNFKNIPCRPLFRWRACSSLIRRQGGPIEGVHDRLTFEHSLLWIVIVNRCLWWM
jgi:hypothetical protein